MKFDYSDILTCYSRYVELLVAKTKIPLTIPNIAASGAEVEQAIRCFIGEFLPDRFRLTHGHIAFTESRYQRPLVSPQIDLLVIDNLVPNSLFRFGRDESPEIVPYQAVVGIFEIKRTFSKRTLIEAITHLDKVAKSINFERSTSEKYILGGHRLGRNLEGGYYGIPMIGAISLDHDLSIEGNFWKIVKENNLSEMTHNIDILFSMSGFTVNTFDRCKQTVDIFPVRSESIELGEMYEAEKSKRVAFALGFMLSYLLKTSGRIMNPLDYLFNDPQSA